MNIGENGQMTEALTRLHGRACQITYEVVSLLRAGHADGAMARWRTLHEVSAVARFVVAKRADIGTRYLAHDVIESRKAARGFQAMAARFRHKPLSQRELDRINQAAGTSVAKYGPEFDEEYGWAAHALNNRRPKSQRSSAPCNSITCALNTSLRVTTCTRTPKVSSKVLGFWTAVRCSRRVLHMSA